MLCCRLCARYYVLGEIAASASPMSKSTTWKRRKALANYLRQDRKCKMKSRLSKTSCCSHTYLRILTRNVHQLRSCVQERLVLSHARNVACFRHATYPSSRPWDARRYSFTIIWFSFSIFHRFRRKPSSGKGPVHIVHWRIAWNPSGYG